MCEYLASRGFVVATTHPCGISTLEVSDSPADLETMIGDREFLLAQLRDLSFVDSDKLGVLGVRSGATMALLMQMRNSDIEAVAALQGTLIDSVSFAQIRSNPFYDNARAQVPLLSVYGTLNYPIDPGLYESLRYSSRYAVELPGAHPRDFMDYYLLMSEWTDSLGTAPATREHVYQAVCLIVRNYFAAELNGDEAALASLRTPPPEMGGEDFIRCTHVPGWDVPPTPQQFAVLLQNNQIDLAVELYEKFRRLDPGIVLFTDAVMNAMAYRTLQTGHAADAVRLFKMNAECYPNSANSWDSLADGYQATGDNQAALECYRKVLEVLPNDAAVSNDLRETLRTNAEQGIERLSSQG